MCRDQFDNLTCVPDSEQVIYISCSSKPQTLHKLADSNKIIVRLAEHSILNDSHLRQSVCTNAVDRHTIFWRVLCEFCPHHNLLFSVPQMLFNYYRRSVLGFFKDDQLNVLGV